ncbi:MAG: LptF/LptG family permease, partial [Alphaproteobacteria bacterium]
MGRSTRYIARQVTGALVFVTVALTGVVWLSQSLRFVDLIVNKGLSVLAFLTLTLLLLPTFLALILPIALFCAALYTYSRLVADREVVALL